MEAIVKNYKRGRKTMTGNQLVLISSKVDSKSKASALVGKKVVWKTKSGKTINGKIASAHGDKGAMRARFTKGIPGQAIGTKIEIVE